MLYNREELEKQIIENPALIRNRVWRLNNLYSIINEDKEHVTFKMRPVQEDYHYNRWYLNLILKSRQHGITSKKCIDFLDAALFIPNLNCGIIAHNVVSARDFYRDKIKFAYNQLPDVVKDSRPTLRSSGREIVFSNNSKIRIGTTFVSYNLHKLHISEFGKICKERPDRAEDIVTGALNTVHRGSEIDIESTAEGREGYFYEMCDRAQKMAISGQKLTQLDYKFFFFAWWQDQKNQLPKDEAKDVVIYDYLQEYFKRLKHKHFVNLNLGQQTWYTKKWIDQGEQMYQQHPSIWQESFKALIKGAYYEKQFQKIWRERRIRKVPYEPALPVNTYWDLGRNDDNAIWFSQELPNEIRLIDYYENSGEGLPFYIGILREKEKKNGWIYGKHYAPHDIGVTEYGTNVARIDTARKLGVKFIRMPRLGIQDGIDAVRRILDICYFDEEKTHAGYSKLEEYRKEWDARHGVWKDTAAKTPAIHAADAFRTLGMAWGLERGLFDDIDLSGVAA